MTTWKQEKCSSCDGHGLVSDYSGGDFNGPMECKTCEGTGSLYVSARGAIAVYPGGHFVGRLTKKELETNEQVF